MEEIWRYVRIGHIHHLVANGCWFGCETIRFPTSSHTDRGDSSTLFSYHRSDYKKTLPLMQVSVFFIGITWCRNK